LQLNKNATSWVVPLRRAVVSSCLSVVLLEHSCCRLSRLTCARLRIRESGPAGL
jgi:hypothetical protein